MNRPEPPFYANRDDDKSCSLAVYRSLIEKFTGKPVDWAYVENLTGFQPKIAAWTVKALTDLTKEGWDIKVFEPFDYSIYLSEGESYLKAQFGKEIADWQIKNSNVLEMKQYIPEFLEKVNITVKNPSIEDIEDMIDEGRLVSLVLNSKALNNQPGYVGHSVLIFDYDDDNLKFHDPGLPGVKSRIEKKELALMAMGKASDATGFKLSDQIK